MSDQAADGGAGAVAPLSRRTFVGVALGMLGSLIAACRPASPDPKATPVAASLVEASPTVVPSPPTLTPVPPTTTASATPPPPPATPRQPSATPPSPTATGSAAETPVASTVLPPSPSPSPSPSSKPLPPTPTAAPATSTNPPPPTTTLAPALDRATLMAHWPATGTSRVAVVHHGGVWAGRAPDLTLVLQMLDDGLRTLTGMSDALAVWRTLFDPGERVLLKVNCIAYGGPTPPAVAYAVAQRLQEAGLSAANILIFDRNNDDLAGAGYALNDGGPGVQCYGREKRGSGSQARLSQATARFYQEIDACDAIINLPIPKTHGMAGVSVSLKNHYGSIENPYQLHGNNCDPAIAELNAHPNLRDKTRLVVGAALTISPADWDRPIRENALLVSFDPVALDSVARDMLVRGRQSLGLDTGFLVGGVRHLRTAQSLNLGATDAALIDLREVTLA